MDSMAAIHSPWVEADDLHLPANHPGRNDAAYLRRRKMFFYLARDLRLRELPAPTLHYTAEERQTWREVSTRLDELHREVAAALFLRGKERLALDSAQVPQLADLAARTEAATGVRLTPAEGLLHGQAYFRYWSQRVMPCTQFLRHAGQPAYTPEPDMIHDVIGHVPPLMDAGYADLIQEIGRLAQCATAQQLDELVRFYWFTIEFGLLEEHGAVRALGAGVLSSIGEIQHAFSGGTTILPFDLDEICATPFDTTELQPVLFVAKSLEEIRSAAKKLSKRWSRACAA